MASRLLQWASATARPHARLGGAAPLRSFASGSGEGWRSLDEVRESFLQFHEERHHVRLPSSSVVPEGDGSLLFSSAGMVQFKEQILGRAPLPPLLLTKHTRNAAGRALLPPTNSLYSSAVAEGPWVTTVQKCVRAGGKGCDLHEIGASPRHLSFFEMLGTFRLPPTSSAAMERENRHWAMSNAFAFLTQCLHLDPARIRATVLKGDKDTKKYWESLLGEGVVYECGFGDNFWAMGGDKGLPCGPCTELYYDFSTHLPSGRQLHGESLLPPDDPNCMELWNLVFMQHEHSGAPPLAAGSPFEGLATLKSLKDGGCIDTGMGLERVTSVVQGVQNSTFKIDTLSALIGAIRQRLLEVTGQTEAAVPYADFSDPLHSQDEALRHASTSLRVIADHLRSACVILSDGVVPSATGRGHVLRRIIRRAVLHAKLLGLAQQPLLSSLVPFVESSLSSAYPELATRGEGIKSLLELEEELTHRSLQRGLKALEEAIDRAAARGLKQLEARVVHELHDSLGFPAELVTIFAERRGFTVPMAEVEELIEDQREKSRSTWSGSGEVETIGLARSSQSAESSSTGHQTARHEPYGPELARKANILEVVKAEPQKGGANDQDSDQKAVFVSMDPCPFYAEGGGQIGDRGTLSLGGQTFSVVNCTKRAGVVLIEIRQDTGASLDEAQIARLQEAAESGAVVVAAVDRWVRAATSRNHTATHLLHASLRQVLGPTVHQAGSYVGPDRLRFDFTAPSPLTAEEIEAVEARVRELIGKELKVTASEHTQEEAASLDAICLFSDKHSDKDLVRVVTVEAESSVADCASREWCGGTHVTNTAQIRPFVIVSERSVAAGTRRIECLTGAAAEEHLIQQRRIATRASHLLHTVPETLIDVLSTRIESEKTLANALEQERLQSLVRSLPSPKMVESAGGHRLAVYDLASLSSNFDFGEASAHPKQKKKQPSLLQRLRAIAPQLATQQPSHVTVLVDSSMLLVAADAHGTDDGPSAADFVVSFTRTMDGCKQAGKPSAAMGMVLLPPGSRETALRALGVL